MLGKQSLPCWEEKYTTMDPETVNHLNGISFSSSVYITAYKNISLQPDFIVCFLKKIFYFKNGSFQKIFYTKWHTLL